MRGKYEGSLLGIFIADALAATGIGLSKEEIKSKYGSLRDLIGGGKLNLDPGECTDEGQMTASVLESICTLRSFKPDNIAQRFVGWLKSRPRDIDDFTRHVLERQSEGETWQEASEAASYDKSLDTAGSIAIIYSIPVALLRIHRPKKLLEDVSTACRITHWDERCVQGALVACYAVTRLALGEPDVYGKSLAFAAEHAPIYKEPLAAVPQMRYDDLQPSGYSIATVQSAFWFLLNSDSFENAVCRAAALGGKRPDAIAALTGAFFGAAYGRSGIPERWIYQVVGRDRIEVLASRLYELSIA
ncbi:MAG: ADP-ribosylglycohydrolase family protein [Acidobacteriota bacterium]|nr:ADP-ribosylglycohydrolase family protein [Blastocatellia bacterium]MDW8413131.1 ADP-ribosylglycohydrolase family protein [Acidobacteriota bacterium]